MNDLPARHLLPIDPTLHGDEHPTPEVRTVVHLHGHKALPESDGYPEAWFTNGFVQRGPFFETKIPEFFGDTVLVNGKVWPFLEVEPRKY